MSSFPFTYAPPQRRRELSGGAINVLAYGLCAAFWGAVLFFVWVAL